MATNATRSQQSAADKTAAHAALAQETGARRIESSSASDSADDSSIKRSGYGLPCAKCRLYYPADLDICPTCHHHERVAPTVPNLPPKPSQTATAPSPDTRVVEHEREEFLRQFKSQLLEAHADVASAPAPACGLGGHHPGEAGSAEICKACYERLQERLDVCEAALHLDLKEAAQIIYDAVWADPSDPNKTYQNAANALLTELRKRAGMNSLHGPFHPLSH
ncbi:MAG TPA: hypothetical protein VFE61_06710 [Candidatus Sulfotelmatobacter sp.]|nr:hypothetical protein [Candidatus Sulfotelmatobacter sp.]